LPAAVTTHTAGTPPCALALMRRPAGIQPPENQHRMVR
jgi:hypothetical protein